MHDLVHDLAHYMMGDVVAHLPATEAELHWRIRHVWSGYLKMNPVLLKNVKGLRTYIADYLFVTDVLEQTRLRALGWNSHENMVELLSSIYVLKHLRYLNLSRSNIKELPESICSLWNLQILNLNDCYKLKTLPNGMGRLKSLRYLYLNSCCRLSNMPMSMGNLTSLRTWSIVIVGESEKLGFQLSALDHFKHLKGEMEIKNLERVREVGHAQTANLMEKRDLDRLTFTWESGFDDVDRNPDHQLEMLTLEALRPSPKLKYLQVDGFGGERFPPWVMNDIGSFKYIQSVRLWGCRKCQQLPPLWRLPSLKRLDLKKMGSVRYLIEEERESYGNEGTYCFSFSSLEELQLENLVSLEAFVHNAQNIVLFPRLSKLIIKGCRRLSHLPTFRPLSSLRYLEIDDIALLTNPTNVQFLNSLEELVILPSNSLEFFPANQMLQGMTSIRKLTIWNCGNLKSLHESHRSAATLPQLDTPPFPLLLQSLSIYGCKNLESWPDWLSDAMSLEEIVIFYCPKLTSIPNYFQHLTKLKRLFISNCPELSSRCKKETGEDWDNIAHVPHIKLDFKRQ